MGSLAEDRNKSASVAEILKALAHPVRLRIVAMLAEEAQHVGRLAERLAVSQSAVSQHIAILRMRDLVTRSWQNGRAVYRLNEPRLPELLRCLEGCSAK